MNKVFKWLFVLVFIVIVFAAGFTFTVREGSCAIVTRFGRIVNVQQEAGLYLKFPWPVDSVTVFDTRNQYMESGYIEILTNDRINVILQAYLVWNIKDPAVFYNRIGSFESAQGHLNNIIANAKNGALGNYTFSSLVSTNIDEIKLDEISKTIEEISSQSAINNLGIEIQTLKIKRIALPDANIQSVFLQIITDRNRYAAQYLAEGERDAAIIRSEAEAKAAEIIAQGRLDAAEVAAETERRVAEIYADAYNRNAELFVFLKNLAALENSVNPETVIIMRASESPFSVITGN